MTEVVCRRARDEDVAALASLRYAWRVIEDGEFGLDEDQFRVAMSEWWASHRTSHLGYLATREGRPVGCAWLCVIDRVPGPGQLLRRAGVVQSVYVRPDERDRGVGTALLDVLIDDARSLELSYLSVHPSERSPSFYRRLGFAPYDRVLELRF